MKITVIQDYLRSGGTERQSVLLANAFAAAGHASTLLTFRPGGALRPTIAPAVGQVVLQPFDTGLDWFAPGLKTVVGRLAPDVVLAMGRMANCYAGGLQRARTSGPRPAAVVATMRTGQPLPALFRRSLLAARHVVANSHEARDSLVHRFHVPAAKISVIHNPLVFRAPGPAAAGREETRAKHGAGPGTSVLLSVAMFRPEKNQAALIELASGLPPDFAWQLWLAGDGPARAACERLAEGHGLGDRVRFLGWQADPSALYAAADLAVHASWSESLSNFVIEAQASGLPAVVYAAQGIAECLVPGETGEVIARDQPEAFRAAILRYCAGSPSERAARAGKARAYARTTFDPEHQLQAYLRLLEGLVS